jgi:hypothetical protein
MKFAAPPLIFLRAIKGATEPRLRTTALEKNIFWNAVIKGDFLGVCTRCKSSDIKYLKIITFTILGAKCYMQFLPK